MVSNSDSKFTKSAERMLGLILAPTLPGAGLPVALKLLIPMLFSLQIWQEERRTLHRFDGDAAKVGWSFAMHSNVAEG